MLVPAGAWFTAVSEEINRSEYRFSAAADGTWSAPNRAHDLRTRIAPAGIEITSRTRGADPEEGGWTLRLGAAALGRDGGAEPGPPTQPDARDGRIELRRGLLTEWYVNDEKGLKQGFNIIRPPEKGGSDRPLVIEMALAGGLGAYPSADGQSVLFKTGAGNVVLRYAELLVWDAAGSRLHARIALLPGVLQIRIADQEAVYPLTVDPLMTSPAWSAESNQTTAQFGASVATAGDVNGDRYSDVIVGANQYDNGQGDEGAVFVFLGSASGLSAAPAWTAESDQVGAQMGSSVATAGDVNGDGYGDILVGAYLYDNVETDEGAAFIWYGGAAGPGNPSGLGSNGTPSNADWTAEGDQAGAWFGYSVATAGDVNRDGHGDVIVGAYFYDNGQTDEGRAFVYLGSASGPNTAMPAWTGESDQAFASFGLSVATAGDVNGDGYSDVIVGAEFYDNGQGNEGAAFVWHGGASEAGNPSGLGPDGTPSNADWAAESNQANARFGRSVASAGDVDGDGDGDVIIGAWMYDGGQTDEGRVFIYKGSGLGLGSSPSWITESNQANAFYGYSVATAGDVNGDGLSDVIVGAYTYTNGQVLEGRAFLFEAPCLGNDVSPPFVCLTATPVGPPFTSVPDWTAESDQASALFGFSVATAGDVNGDGYSDVVVGAILQDNGQTDEGRAFVYLGSASGLNLSPHRIAQSNQAFAFLGISVATAGDVNGDGYSDVIVGAWQYDNGQTDEGRAFVYLGSASGPDTTTPAWTGESDQAGAAFGFSVGTAGDTNGDGYSDVIIGANSYDNVEANEGRAFVYLGSPAGLGPEGTPANADWIAESNQAFARFGGSVSTAGDVNGDGLSDVIVGADGYDNVEVGEGRAFVYLGSASGPSLTPAWTAESNQASALLGISVATAGDVNGDGYSDVIVGALIYDNPEANEGAAFVYLGSATGLGPDGTPANADWIAESNQSFAQFGISTATAGDVNGDGFGDVIVGAAIFDNGQVNEGAAFAWYGGPAGLGNPSGLGPTGTPANADWMAESNQADAEFGSSVASAGDVDGDGFSDVIVGANEYDNGETQEGRAFVYKGSASGLAAAAAWTAESNQTGALFGISVARAGDVNGDGFSDVIVGAHGYDDAETNEGAAFIYYGNQGFGTDRISRQARADDSAPIDLLGTADSPSSFRLKARGRTPAGRGRVRLEMEVKPLGTAFDGLGFLGAISDTGPLGVTASAVELNELVSPLTTETPYTWRLRIRTDSPFFPSSPWLTLPNTARLTKLRTGCLDADGDGYRGNPSCPAETPVDCDDTNPARFPGNPEVCDALDNDCDGSVPSIETDGDGDTYVPCSGCLSPVLCDDCDDTVASVYPGAPQVCDGLNNNCSDLAWPALTGTNEFDDDGDTFSECGGDCDDALASVYPGAPQVCDGLNNSCSDPAWPALTGTNEFDDDGDTYTECGGDCTDANGTVWNTPGAATGLTLSADRVTIIWSAPASPGAASVVYDTIRSTDPNSFDVGAVCVESDGADTTSTDATPPALGTVLYYLVVVENACPPPLGRNAGSDSSGLPRTARDCP